MNDPLFAPNLVNSRALFDFDAVVVDPAAVWIGGSPPPGHAVYAKSPSEFQLYDVPLEKKKEEAEHLLARGGIILCFLRPKAIVARTYYDDHLAQRTDSVSSYDWVPIQGLSDLVIETEGERITKTSSSPFDPYLSLDGIVWRAYLERPIGTEGYTTLATNEANFAIAARIKVGRGAIFLLPFCGHATAPNVLMDCLAKAFKGHTERQSPAWMSTVQVPGEGEILQSLQTTRKQIIALQEKEHEIVSEYDRVTLAKKLLYEQGIPLEEAVKASFRELGMELQREGDRDLVTLEGSAKQAIFEVTGSEGTIDVGKLRQLLDYVMEQERKKGSTPKCILVGNHQIGIAPEKRGRPFTQKAVERSEIFDICLLPTIELFKALVSFRRGKLEPKEFLNSLLVTKGEFSLKGV